VNDGFANALGRLNELHPRPIVHDFLVYVADPTVCNPAFQDDRLVPESQPNVMERIQMQRECSFDQTASLADLLDRERLEDHHLAVQLSKDLNPFGIAFFL